MPKPPTVTAIATMRNHAEALEAMAKAMPHNENVKTRAATARRLLDEMVAKARAAHKK